MGLRILNTRIYDVMFPDGNIQQYSTNVIAENIYSQVDDEGHRYLSIDEIIDVKKDESAIEKGDAFTVDKQWNKVTKTYNKGMVFLN